MHRALSSCLLASLLWLAACEETVRSGLTGAPDGGLSDIRVTDGGADLPDGLTDATGLSDVATDGSLDDATGLPDVRPDAADAPGEADGATMLPDGDVSDAGDPGDASDAADAADADAEVFSTGHPKGLPPASDTYPTLVVTPERKAVILDRLDREPYASMLQRLEQRAGRAIREETEEDTWTHRVHGDNGDTAQANGMLAWLFDDEEAAAKAVEILGRLETNLGDSPDVDVHIRMPRVLMGHANALDFLRATPFITDEEVADARGRILEITRKLYDKWVEGLLGDALLGLAQNNYIVRTAASVGYVALAFPDAPEAEMWADWAFGELQRMMVPGEGFYVQADGGISEDAYYGGFSFSPALAAFLAWEHVVGEPRELVRNCTTHALEGPHAGVPCTDGTPYAFDDPLHDPGFQSIADWSLGLRMPNGARATLGDARWIGLNGGAVLSSFSGEGHTVWDFVDNPARPLEMTFGVDLVPHHLAWVDDETDVAPPDWTTRFFEDSGHAVFRSGWDADARWLFLNAEHGDARRTLHDHVDESSIALSAYGEILLMDPGYYKPDALDNAVTADSWSHSLVLIDGRTGPPKGKVVDFGGVDAALVNPHDGERLDWAEAHLTYQGTTVRRGVAFVRDRWFLVADRLDAEGEPGPREHRWRCLGNAGYDRGGVFELAADRARFERELAGVDVHLASTAPGLALEEPPFEEGAPPHVHEVRHSGDLGHHGVVDGVVAAEAPDFLSVLAPYRVGAADGEDGAPLEVTRLDLGEGVVGWQVASADHTEVAILREPSAPTSFTLDGGQEVETDAELALFTVAGEAPAALVSGGQLSIDGEPIGSAEAGAVALID